MSGAVFTRADVREAKRDALAWLGEQASAQRETAGGATEAAYTELAREFARRSGRAAREHPRDPAQMTLGEEVDDASVPAGGQR